MQSTLQDTKHRKLEGHLLFPQCSVENSTVQLILLYSSGVRFICFRNLEVLNILFISWTPHHFKEQRTYTVHPFLLFYPPTFIILLNEFPAHYLECNSSGLCYEFIEHTTFSPGIFHKHELKNEINCLIPAFAALMKLYETVDHACSSCV